MRRIAKIATAAALSLLAMMSAASSPAALLSYTPGMPLIPAPRISQAPVIDGKLDDACWARAAQSSNFAAYSGKGLANIQTKLHLGFDKEKLYVAFQCFDPAADRILARVKDRDGNVWKDDSVELFLDTNRDRTSYFQLILNADGVQYDSEQGAGKLGAAWNANWEAKTLRSSDSWTCEIAIPFSELKKGGPKSGSTWGFNAARNYHGSEGGSNWAGVIGSSHQPKLFGDMMFTEQPMGLISNSLGAMFYGGNQAKLEVYNMTGYSQVMGLRVEVASADDLKTRVSQRLMLTKGERRPLDVNYEIKDGDFLVVELRNDETGDIYQRERYALHLPSPRIQEIKARISDVDAARKLVGNRSATLSKQLDTLSTLLRKKLEEFQGTVDVKTRAKTTLEKTQWEKFQTDFESYSERIRSLGNILWTKSPWLVVMPSDIPGTTTNLDELNLTLCAGATESAVVQVTNLLGSVFNGRLILTDLVEKTGRAGALKHIGREHIVVRNVLYRNQHDGSVIPDALPRANEANQVVVQPGMTTQVWLSLDSRDAAPGSYTGTITLKPFNRSFQTKEIRLNLTILPIKLPEKMPIATYNWDYATNEAYVQDLSDHRVNTFLLTAPLPELSKDAKLVKSGDYNSAQLQLKRDFGQLMYSYGIIPSYDKYVQDTFHWQFMDENWQKGFRAWITDWMAKLKEIGVGYADFSVQLWDEPKGEEIDKVARAGKLLREIDPNIRTVMDPSFAFSGMSTSLDDMKKMAPYVDIWVQVLAHLQKDTCPDADKEMEFLKSTGKPVWIYTCSPNMPALSPIGYYRLKPWQTWSLGLSGCAFWAYNSWRGDSWDDFDIGEEGYSDNGAIYQGDYGPITTRRWEAYRAGLEDYLYLYLANATIEKGKKARIDMNALLAAKDVLDKATPEVLAGAENDPGIIDSARGRIADQIMALNKLMPFSAKAPAAEAHDADIIIKWETSEPCVGTVYYRKKGSPSWRVVTNLLPETTHSMTVSGLRSGVTYEYYVSSVNDVGLIQVDDNNAAFYICTR